ncbi:MAG: ABC transporter permease [Bdellovibrionia bacterium]
MNIQWRLAALKNGFQDATAYRWEFLFEILGSAFVPAAIQCVLWYALFEVGGAKEVGGMNYADLVTYTGMSLLFSQIRGGDHDFELQELIRTGQLSNYLLRPVGVVEFIYIRGVAPRIFISFLCLMMGVAASYFLNLSPARILGAMLLAFLGNVIHYQIGATLSTSAFFLEEAHSVLMVKNMVVNLLSGELIPLNLFPPSLQWIWKTTPFYLYVFAPTQFALGKATLDDYFGQLMISLLWLLAGWAAIRLSWSVGMKRYVSLGG